jgi:hypothetical protein
VIPFVKTDLSFRLVYKAYCELKVEYNIFPSTFYPNDDFDGAGGDVQSRMLF